MNYLDIANSNLMLVMCSIPIVVVCIQAVRFMIMAWKQGLAIGMDKEKLKKCIVTSISVSVVPALSVVAVMIAMSSYLGKYFPWLRLSVIGAGGYETTAAAIGLEALGLTEYSALTPGGLAVIMLVMNVGMSIAPLFVCTVLKKYDNVLKGGQKTSPFLLIGTSAAFAAVMARLNLPYFTNAVNNPLPFLAAVAGAISMFVCTKLKKKFPILGDFALTIAIVTGVTVCCVVAAL